MTFGQQQSTALQLWQVQIGESERAGKTAPRAAGGWRRRKGGGADGAGAALAEARHHSRYAT